MSKTGTNSLKGKTWEEIYGIDKTIKLKTYKRNLFKGISFDERYGIKRAKKIKKKISVTSKGHQVSIKQHAAIIKSNKTRIISKITRKKMSNSHKGYKWSEKSKEKARLSHIGIKNHFFGKKHTKEAIDKIKKSRQYLTMPQKDTIPELKTQSILVRHNISFEKHKKILGRPDMFIEPNICIFVDGDYWHGNPNKYKPTDIIGAGKRKMPVFNKWKYDKKITNELKKLNYKVLRFWEHNINNKFSTVECKIIKTVGEI